MDQWQFEGVLHSLRSFWWTFSGELFQRSETNFVLARRSCKRR